MTRASGAGRSCCAGSTGTRNNEKIAGRKARILIIGIRVDYMREIGAPAVMAFVIQQFVICKFKAAD